MSKLECSCGHVIRDQSDDLRYKAYFLRDFDEPALFDPITKESQALVEAERSSEQGAAVGARRPRRLAGAALGSLRSVWSSPLNAGTLSGRSSHRRNEHGFRPA